MWLICGMLGWRVPNFPLRLQQIRNTACNTWSRSWFFRGAGAFYKRSHPQSRKKLDLPPEHSSDCSYHPFRTFVCWRVNRMSCVGICKRFRLIPVWIFYGMEGVKVMGLQTIKNRDVCYLLCFHMVPCTVPHCVHQMLEKRKSTSQLVVIWRFFLLECCSTNVVRSETITVFLLNSNARFVTMTNIAGLWSL